jgi:hypothetical protein
MRIRMVTSCLKSKPQASFSPTLILSKLGENRWGDVEWFEEE